MENNQNNNSIFLTISNILKGNRKDVLADLSQRNLLTNTPAVTHQPPTISDTVEQKQQDFLDIQSLKVAQDLYSRQIYFNADRISAINDFRAMDQSPEISVALDIMADECIAFDTVIPLLNGEKSTVEQLFNEKKSNFWVYSYNIEKKCMEPALCERIAYKGKQNVYKVIFDDNSFVKVTDEHLWLMKSDKSYKKTKDLKTGDSIQPFYSRISNTEDRINGYEMILEDNGKWEYTHRIVKRKINPNTIGVCHHKDFNKLNNEPENLQVMDYFDHQKYHASLNSEKWNNEDFANKMRQIFSETNSKNGPYWSDPKWREKRVEQARKTTIKFQSTLTEEEKRKLYGLPGDLNGMYNNGKVLIGEKNGRYKHDLKHEFTTEEIINAYKCTKNIDEACELLNTNKIILRKSNAYKSLAIDRWEDLNILLGEINFENLNRECEKYKSEFILERNFRKICKLNNWNSKVVTKFLQKNDFSSWNNYVEQFDSRTHCINKIKDLYINHTNVDNGISFKTFCDQHNLRPKQVEGAISRSKHKNWSGFLSSINHSIKEIVFVGQEKTYDLINVSDNNNYAILSSNGTGVFVHNCVTRSDRGEILSIYSENTRIKKILKSLFSGVLNIDFNLWFWIRELLKYGDNFLKLEIDKENGVYDVIQLPTGEIDKKIGTDKDPREVQYIWRGNSEHRFVEWQVAHFSLISDGRMMPFGRSILDPARKLWKQLQLAEDAMLVYRLVRAPERRIFYLEVGNSDPADIKQYIESMKRELKKSPVVDQSGNVNMKFNLVTFEEDYFIPIRGDKSSRIETLPGACLALDTEIYLLDGRCIPLSQIITEFEQGKQLEAYSINPVTGEIVPGPITWAGVTRKNTEVLKITLDNGETITCTPDHKFPTRFNGKKEAKDLLIGESLWSFNKKFEKVFKKKKAKEYEMIYTHDINDWVYTHRMVAEYVKKNGIIKEHIFDDTNIKKPKNLIHHYDFNHLNNSSDNLYYMNFHDHVMLHQSFAKNYIANRNEGIKEYWNNISSEEYNKKIATAISNFKKGSDKLQELLKDENYKKEFYEKTSASLKIIKNTTENKLRQSAYSKAHWENDDYRLAVIEKQTIKYTNNMLQFIVKNYNNGLSAEEILIEINTPNSEFITEFNLLNAGNEQLKKMKNGFTHNNLYKMMKHFGYDNWRDFKNKVECFNHKILSIEWLVDTQDTGTITIDGNEYLHDYHNFALKSGVFTSNSNLGDIADIEYLQNKLFTAIKVPKTYLNYGEALPGGSTLSQADLRFSRTINRIQEAVVLELRRIANIHLILLGFDDDVDNFTLTLTNPSTQQELLKLETMKARNDVFKEMFSSDATSPVSYAWGMEFILGFSKSEIKQILRQKKIERKIFYEIERAHLEYMDTGLFTELDKKFRKPDFDPNTEIDPETGEATGGEGEGGGGGSALQNPLGSLGNFDLNNAGGGGGESPDMGGDFGGGASAGVPSGAELAGADEPIAAPEDNMNERNTLLKKNNQFNFKTKSLLEGIEHYLNKIKHNEGDDNIELTQDDIDKL